MLSWIFHVCSSLWVITMLTFYSYVFQSSVAELLLLILRKHLFTFLFKILLIIVSFVANRTKNSQNILVNFYQTLLIITHCAVWRSNDQQTQALWMNFASLVSLSVCHVSHKYDWPNCTSNSRDYLFGVKIANFQKETEILLELWLVSRLQRSPHPGENVSFRGCYLLVSHPCWVPSLPTISAPLILCPQIYMYFLICSWQLNITKVSC